MSETVEQSGTSSAGWLILGGILAGAAAGAGAYLAYRAGVKHGREEAEQNPISGRDIESFAGAEFGCRPCDPTETLQRGIPAGGNPGGRYWTRENIDEMEDPDDALARPPGPSIEEVIEDQFDQLYLCCEGEVAAQPQWGRLGGARQTLVVRRGL